MTTELYPLLFTPRLVERPWGGHTLRDLFDKPIPADQTIGETWEIYSDNVIANGALAGQTLHDALHTFGDRIGAHDGDDFPLLIKFLDAREWLSVQVHPNDEQAARLEGQPRGKTECWYVIHAQPGAQIAYGLAHEMSAEAFRAAIANGKTRETLALVNVSAGDFIYVPATTIHALGPGLVVYELQQTSDTTYRVYDWDRVGKDGQPRALHIDKALAVSTLTPAPDGTLRRPSGQADTKGNWCAALVRGPYFGLDHVRLLSPQSVYGTNGSAQLITVLDGSLSINDIPVKKGDSVLIPAALGNYSITQSARAEVLRAWPIANA